MSTTAPEVVVHITSGDESDWRQALRNLANLYTDESVPVPAERMTIVVNGSAVRFLRSHSPEADRLSRISEAGIQINACGRSLDRLGYDSDSLADGVTTVSSGVAEVVRLQSKATASYLKLP